MRRLGDIFSICADILGVGAFIGILLLLYGNYNIPESLNIHSYLVGILSAIITLLVAWNIYATIDAREFKKRLEREINYAQNKMDDNTADTYAFLCQTASVQLSNQKEYTIKLQCLWYGISSVKIYSRIPGDIEKANVVISSMIEMLQHTRELKFDKKQIRELVLDCGAISDRDSLNEFETLIHEIELCEAEDLHN